MNLSYCCPAQLHTRITNRDQSCTWRRTGVQEFLYILNQVIWQEVYVEQDVNAKFSTFMDVFLHCCNNAFPIKTEHMRDTIKNKWITPGIKISSKRMQLPDNQRKTTVMENKFLEYIDQYKKIQKGNTGSKEKRK